MKSGRAQHKVLAAEGKRWQGFQSLEKMLESDAYGVKWESEGRVEMIRQAVSAGSP